MWIKGILILFAGLHFVFTIGNAQVYGDLLEKDSVLVDRIITESKNEINSPGEIPRWARRMHRDYGTFIQPKMIQFDNSDYQWAGILSGIVAESFICGLGNKESGFWVSLLEYGQMGYIFYSKQEKKIIVIRTGILNESNCPSKDQIIEILSGNRRILVKIQNEKPRCFLFLKRSL